MKHFRSFALFLVVFCVAYAFIQRSGIMAAGGASYDQIFFMPPFLAAGSLLALSLVVCVSGGHIPHEIKQWLLIAGIILMTAGLWTSYLTRIDLELVLSEGQSVGINSQNVVGFGGYAGKMARFPQFHLKLASLVPEFSSDRKSVTGMFAEYSLLTDNGKPPQEIKKSSISPSMRSGFIVWFKDFGYSPRYILKGENGEEIDSAFVALKLFPSGSEDYFRLLSPHTYYVRYFPEGMGNTKEPGFNLRIARNKDLVLNRSVKLNEDILYDGNTISFAEVKQWTKFRVVRDPGYLLWPVGILCTGIALLVSLRSRYSGIKK